MWPLRSKKPIFSEAENKLIVDAIREAEKQTSGEVRVFVEKHCKYVDALDRARKIFDILEMEKTALRNAVLFYIAVKDHQLAIFGDKGIHEVVGDAFWKEVVHKVLSGINDEKMAEKIAAGIIEIGAALQTHFPYDAAVDKNELPDEIVFASNLSKPNS